jgi:hypothetical protein
MIMVFLGMLYGGLTAAGISWAWHLDNPQTLVVTAVATAVWVILLKISADVASAGPTRAQVRRARRVDTKWREARVDRNLK